MIVRVVVTPVSLPYDCVIFGEIALYANVF